MNERKENKIKMKKTKTQKGITLIALIITIVVLLILAAVAISSITNDGILSYAQNAAKDYNQAVKNEQDTLQGYLNYLNNGGSGEKTPVEPKVGQYVEYDVSYTDMYQGTEYTSINGWRYLGTDGDGNKLLVSTAIPIKLFYSYTENDSSAKWWDTDTTLNKNVRVINGIVNNFDKIPFEQKVSGTNMTGGKDENTAIGAFPSSKRTYDETEYNALGDYFKSSKYESEIENVRTLTLAELNRAMNSATGGSRVETSTLSGFKNLTDEALGLFDMQDLTGYTADYSYWLASPDASLAISLDQVSYRSDDVSDHNNMACGIRPVVVFSSDVQFTNSDIEGVLKIK